MGERPKNQLLLPEECVTPQERELLSQLSQRINQTQLQEKDPDAENLLGRELGANPDAIYILAQTVLVQDIALQQARAQVTQLQSMVEQARQQASQPHATSFLGRLLGERDEQPARPAAPPPGYPPQGQGWQQPQQPPFQPVQYAPQAPPYAAPQYAAPAYGAPMGQPSFLRGAMQTAAGVAAGALAFEGVESILHGFGHGGGMGMSGMGMGMGGGFQRPMEETVINNYYDGAGGDQAGHHGGADQHFDGGDNLRGFDNAGAGAPQSFTGRDELTPDEMGQGAGYQLDDSADATHQLSAIDQGTNFDDAQDDTAALDDGGGLDDSGGFDDGGGGDSGF